MLPSLEKHCTDAFDFREDEEITAWTREIDRLELPWCKFFSLQNNQIFFHLPFFSFLSPYCFPLSTPLESKAVKLCLAYLLENYEYILAIEGTSELHEDFRKALLLKVEHNECGTVECSTDPFRDCFNKAIYFHYINDDLNSPIEAEKLYLKAIENAENQDQSALAAVYYTSLLTDQNRCNEAGTLLKSLSFLDLSETTEAYFDATVIDAFARNSDKSVNAENFKLIQKTKDCLAFFEQDLDRYRYTTLLESSAKIARKQGNLSESLSCLSKASSLYLEMDMPEYKAQIDMEKAEIYHIWGQKQNPAFYKQALEHYNSAVNIFNKEDFPLVYADIQLQIALLYSEKPEEKAKTIMMRSMAIQSFKNAINTADAERNHLQYARICHNYASALLKFEHELSRDSLEKAEELIGEALKYRTAEESPLERAYSLLTAIEVLWIKFQRNPEQIKFIQEIKNKLDEVIGLSDNAEIATEVKLHRESLEKVSEELTTNA